MVETTYIGGKSFVVTRAEGSKADLTLFGTYASGGTDDKYLYATNFTDPRRNNMIRIYSLGGGRSYVAAVPGKYEMSGTLEFEIQNLQHMKYALGAGTGSDLTGTPTTTDLDGVAITGSTTGLKKYILREDDTLDSFSIDQFEISTASANDIRMRYLGCKVNQMTIRSDTENPLHCTFDWIGQKDAIITEGAIAEPTFTSYTDAPKMFYTGTLFLNPTVTGGATPTGAITGGDTVVQANSIDSTMVNNLESYWSINSTSGRGIRYAIEKQREYTLRLDLNFTNTDQLKRFYDGTKTSTAPIGTEMYTNFAIVIDYKMPNSSDTFKQLRYIYRDVFFDETSIPLNPKEIVKQEVTAYAKHLDIFCITAEVV